jgi:hypothetical protein
MNPIRVLVIDTSESTAAALATDLLEVGITAVTERTDSSLVTAGRTGIPSGDKRADQRCRRPRLSGFARFGPSR